MSWASKLTAAAPIPALAPVTYMDEINIQVKISETLDPTKTCLLWSRERSIASAAGELLKAHRRGHVVPTPTVDRSTGERTEASNIVRM
jgi:hypothetical protein